MLLQGEGVAYRGRVLVELSTKLEGKADQAVENIHSDDLLVVQVLSVFVILCIIRVCYTCAYLTILLFFPLHDRNTKGGGSSAYVQSSTAPP